MHLLKTISAITLLVAACSNENSTKTPSEATTDLEAAAENSDGAPAIRLYVLDCGRVGFLDKGIFDVGGAFDGQQDEGVDPCFLVRHPNGDLLWDTGFPDALSAEEEGVTSGAFHVSRPKTLISQLTALGLAPFDIELLSISHSHFDHAGNAGAFSSSTFLISEAEYAYMFRPEARTAAQSFSNYALLEDAETVQFSGDHDVFGDGSVRIISTPGHTPGHASLLINLTNTGPILLSGDLYHFAEARRDRTVPVFNTDVDATRNSMDKFEALAAATGARVIIQHEIDDIEALPISPDFLD